MDADLASLPFPEQIDAIERALAAREPAAAILGNLGRLRDHEPLVWLVRRLGRQGALAGPEIALALEALLLALPDTGVHRLLRGVERAALPPEALETIVGAVAATVRALPIERLAAVCLMDRWLKNAAPPLRAALAEEAVAACRRALETRTLDALPDGMLLRVPGVRAAELERAAGEAGLAAAWRARVEAFGAKLLDVLESAPKSLSQANAEEILSRRVYTDPGHFFFELLQNAEDAGAKAWRVEIGDRQVSVWHDGTPFDGKDVVGVLSIGQTTKQKGQIGFFGIGFKSVYEICERPQLYSGPFRFEIADVSIPRRLAGRPAGAPSDGTLLVLPLRDPADPLRTPEELHRRALGLPARLLLTLHNLRSLGVARGGAQRTLRVEEDRAPGRVRLAREETGETEHYLVESGRFRWEGARDVARSQETPVLVAVALDGEGQPVPLERGAPTIFSYLPTGERSGLRYLVHAHFDLPIDRERLDLDSPWNRWALQCSAGLLGEMVLRLGAEAAASPGEAVRGKRLDRLLEILPLPEEVEHPAYRAILERLADRLAAEGVLPGAAGERLAPRQAFVVEDARLVPALAGVSLDTSGRRPLVALDGRLRKVALALGAARFGPRDLAGLLAATLANRDEGCAPEHAWLRDGARAIADSLGRTAEPATIAALAALPLLPDQDGRLWKASSLSRADEALRGVVGGARRLLDPQMDLHPGPGEDALLRALAVPRYGAADLVRDLATPDFALRLVGERGAASILEYLSRQAPEIVRSLAQLPVFPDERGALRPLVGAGAVWRPAPGPLGELARAMEGARPPLVEADLDGRLGPWLSSLGARTLDLPELLAGLRAGGITLANGDAGALHRVLNDLRDELTPRLCEELASTAIFPDAAGELRPLRGERAVLVPEDEGVRLLAPQAPWIDAEIGRLGHLQRLGVVTVGPEYVARSLLGEEWRLAIDVSAAEDLRRCYAYLAGHAEALSSRTIARLASAPVWLDVQGHPRRLEELRRAPADALLAELYGVWAAFARIEEGGAATAHGLAVALGLGARLAAPDHTQMIADLVAGPAIDASRDELRPALVAALEEAVSRVSPSTMASLARAPIFRAEDLTQHRLAAWDAEVDGACYRALGPAREPLAKGSRPLLHEQDEESLAKVLAALRIPPASAKDLVRAIEEELDLEAPGAATRCRKALAALRSELEQEVSPERLGALPIWPTRDGRLCRAQETVRGADLAEIVGEGWEQALGEQAAFYGVMAPAAEPEAGALAGLVTFRAPVELVVERIRAQAKIGEPLAAQASFLRTQGQVSRLFAMCHRVLQAKVLALPLTVDAAGRLVAGSRMHATSDEIALAEELPLFGDLAEPAWAAAAAALDPKLAPPLPARRMLLGLYDAAREPRPLAGHPLLEDAARRSRLYAWLLARAAEIEEDEQARGVARKACLIASAKGWARAPQELLCDPELPELGIDWNAAPEVPPALVAWIRRVFHMDEDRMLRLVEDLLQRYEAANPATERAAKDELLRFLARTLTRDPEGLPGVSRRLKLPKRLKVEAEGGGYVQPRELVVAPPDRWELIATFATTPPPRLSSRYQDPEVRALIEACGASRTLSKEELAAMLGRHGLRAGTEAALAFANYVALEAADEPKLRHELKLDKAAWIPNALGTPCSPRDLFWPEPALVAAIGERPDRVPHPEFVHAVPAAVRTWLPFREAHEASPDDVFAEIERSGRASDDVLEWLERAVASGRVEAKALRDRLGTRAVFEDDDGILRTPRELVREDAADLFGTARGTWSDGGRRYPRLAAALEVASKAGARDVLRYLEEVARACEEKGPDAVLAAEPDLAVRLPRCLGLLASRPGDRELPVRLPVVGRDPNDVASLCLLPDSRLRLPEPEELADAIRGSRAELLVPALDPDHAEASLALLRKAGVRDLLELWKFELPGILEHDVTGRHEAAARDVAVRVRALWEVLPRVRAALGSVAADRWRFASVQPPLEVRVVDGLSIAGTVAGVQATLACSCGVELSTRRLVLDVDALGRWDLVARELCASAILQGGGAEQSVVGAVEALLEKGKPEAMGAWLDAHAFPGEAKKPERPSRAPQPAKKPPPQAPAPPPAAEEPPESKLWPSVKRWLFGDDEEKSPPGPQPPEPKPERAPPPPRDSAPPPMRVERDRPRESEPEPQTWAAPRHAAWMRPEMSIRRQLDSDGKFTERRQEIPQYGFAFSPSRLPLPYLYGPKIVCERFDRRGQRWLPTGAAEAWPMEGPAGAARVSFRGRAPAGQTILPVPMYGRVVGPPASPARLVRGSDGRPLLAMVEEGDVELEVALDLAPQFDDQAPPPEAPEVLLERTVPDVDLPGEALAAVETLRGGSAFERVGEIRAFIRDRYKYDPGYLEDAGVGRWLSSLSRGRANEHLAALHAGRDARYLGRGVCYELNVLACELLRRAGVPAAICTGWTFDGGQVSEPDHLWAVALLATDRGPRWMPVDASTTRDGIPLHASRRPAGPWRPKPQRRAQPLPKEPRWKEPPAARRAPAAAQAPAIPAADLIRVAQHLAQLTGETLEREDELRRKCLKVLEDPVLGRKLLQLLRS